MHATLRIVALSAALATLTPAASAAQISLDFNQFGTDASDLPVEVGTLQGLSFSGAYGYGAAMLGTDDPDMLSTASQDRGGFLLNKQRGGSTNDIVLTLVQSSARTSTAAPAAYFEAITFKLFTKGTGTVNQLFATGANGEQEFPMTGGGLDSWTIQPLEYSFSPLAQVTALRFTAGGAPFALDDMVVTLTNAPGPGGNVPEPGSYALVGIALLAAGAAGRRNQRR